MDWNGSERRNRIRSYRLFGIMQLSGWLRTPGVLQTWLTPVIAFATVVLGYATWRIQHQQARSAALQAESAKLQAETNRLQYRLALFERRMKVFKATTNLIGAIVRDTRVELQQLFELIRETREHEFLFGPDIGEYIDGIYQRGVELHTAGFGIARGQQADIEKETEVLLWFNEQSRLASQVFLRYLDFREP